MVRRKQGERGGGQRGSRLASRPTASAARPRRVSRDERQLEPASRRAGRQPARANRDYLVATARSTVGQWDELSRKRLTLARGMQEFRAGRVGRRSKRFDQRSSGPLIRGRGASERGGTISDLACVSGATIAASCASDSAERASFAPFDVTFWARFWRVWPGPVLLRP